MQNSNYYPIDLQPLDLPETWFVGAPRYRRNYYHANIPPARVVLQQLHDAPESYGPRPILLEGVVIPNHVGHRNIPPQPTSGYNTNTAAHVDPGHLGALALGFGEYAEIIVPQWADWQRNGPWRAMERTVYQLAVEAIDRNRPFGGIPTRSIFYRVRVYYLNFGHMVCPTLQTWGFPVRFLVQIFNCTIDGQYDPNNPIQIWNMEPPGPPLNTESFQTKSDIRNK